MSREQAAADTGAVKKEKRTRKGEAVIIFQFKKKIDGIKVQTRLVRKTEIGRYIKDGYRTRTSDLDRHVVRSQECGSTPPATFSSQESKRS